MEKNYTLEELKEDLEALTRGFTGYAGIVPVEVDEGYSVCEVEIQPHHFNPMNGAHGGLLYTLADVTGGLACRSLGYRYITTMNSSVSFLRPGLNYKKIIGTGRVIKAGKRSTTVEVEITGDDGTLLTKVISTYFMLEKK